MLILLECSSGLCDQDSVIRLQLEGDHVSLRHPQTDERRQQLGHQVKLDDGGSALRLYLVRWLLEKNKDY